MEVCRDLNFNIHKEENDKIVASYIQSWIGQKGTDDLAGLIW